MSNYLRNNDDATRETVSPLRRRRLWLATGVVGLTGAVSLAGVAYATTGVTGPHRLADVKWSTAQQLSDDAHGDDEGGYGEDEYGRDEHGKDGKDRGQEGRAKGEWGEWGDKGDHGKVRDVPCDDDALVDALDLTNRDHGGTLKLAENCTYEVGVKDRKFGAALPEIKQDVTIKGNGSTIKRDAEDTFRIFRVVDGGALTLKDLTVKGGNANEFKYGGGGQPPAPANGAPTDGAALTPAQPAAPAAPAVAGAQGAAAAQAATAPAQAAPMAAAAPVVAAAPVAVAAPVADAPGKDEKRGEGDGGALLVERGGKAHLSHVKLTHNNAEGNGGAIANYGRVWVEDSKVYDNHAQGDGGGIFNQGVLKVEESHVDDNTAGGNGGGIANGNGLSGKHDAEASALKGYDPKGKHDEAGTVEIIGSDHGKDGVKSTLTNNRAGKNGGGLFSSGGTVTVSFTAITDNTACENGGGVYAENTDLDLDKVHVAKNHADGNGGGVVVTGGKHWGYPNNKDEASATISDSVIVDNTANRFGGGIFNGEWLVKIEDGFLTREHDKDDNATLTIRDTLVKGNTALNGGGIFNNKAKITLTKTHVTKNTATDSSKLHRVAGGVLNNEGHVKLDDESLISNNDPTNCANTVEDCFN
ncbi:polymorphic outer membrane protein repeat-containing protein [Micromonospora sediminicola]|uniref:Polymorphic outer membrane protein repeat-containing protein n=1 Tax=Micromonospora sediminicola TaxID=946078 RepID=A0A1A9B9F6_9ACTN|nr:hypothetical protein [Micromonospora sediminicola]SBT65522.1 polymorphic outer membrane protein repeat-containing protein [Micromonospora sediminicola]